MISIENATGSALGSCALGVLITGDCDDDDTNPGGGFIPGGGAFFFSSGEPSLSVGGFAFFDGVWPSASRSGTSPLGIVGGGLLDGGDPNVPGDVVGHGGMTGSGGTCTIGPLGGGAIHFFATA